MSSIQDQVSREKTKHTPVNKFGDEMLSTAYLNELFVANNILKSEEIQYIKNLKIPSKNPEFILDTVIVQTPFIYPLVTVEYNEEQYIETIPKKTI